MAVEALTKAVIRKTLVERGISEEELAHTFGLVTDDPERPRWKKILDEEVRRHVIFQSDSDTYNTAKKASDGLEHGYLGLDEVARHALKCTDRTFHYVRKTLVELLDLSESSAEKLLAIKPKDVQSLRKVVRGRFLGSAEEMAHGDEMYPTLVWTSGIDSMEREDSTISFEGRENLTVRANSDLTFQLDRFEVHGRLEEGQLPINIQPVAEILKQTPEAKSADLFRAMAPLIEAATAGGDGTEMHLPRTLAFFLFGQAAALSESVQVLIENRLPIEALPALRALVIIASRFEQIDDTGGHGIGIVIRMALDALDDLGFNSELVDQRRGEILAAAALIGATIPDALEDPTLSAIYSELKWEMQLATGTSDGAFSTAGLHVVEHSPGHFGFHTRLDPGPLTEMIASACVIAQLRILKRASRLFDLEIDDGLIEHVIDQAMVLNAGAAEEQGLGTQSTNSEEETPRNGV